MSFNKHPSAVAMHPVMPHPNRMRTRGKFPTARGPDITCTVPAVIAGDPYISTPGRRTVVFHNRVRRPDANVNLPVGSSRKQRAGQQGCKRKLLHDDDILRDSKAASGIFWKFQYLCELNAEIED